MRFILIINTVLLVLYGTQAVQVDHKNPDAFEGDIGLDPETRALINGDLTENGFKGVSGNKVWTGGIIPYTFDRNFGQRRKQLVNQAIEQYNRHTCVSFRTRTNERNYVYMVDQNACWSMIGRVGGRQLLKLGGHCLQLGTTMHEMMHAAGFYHEQSRYDRDEHVNILWNNIKSGESYNFQKYRTNYYGQAYDLNSIMHYRNNEFSRNSGNTIEAKKNRGLRLGNTRFSDSDIKAINSMYGCNTSPPTSVTPNPGGGCSYSNDKDQKCRPWAETGYCTSTDGGYLKIMGEKCCNSCRQYAKCVDTDSNCPGWANNGECKKNPSWMLKNCRKSCKECL